MAEFSPQFLDQFRDFQAKKRQAALARTGQYLGGGARALRTGESAAQAIAERDPFARGTMDTREKLDRTAALTGALDQQEQTYAKMAQEERQQAFDQIMAAYRAQLQAEVSAMEQMGASARTAAQLKIRAYDHNVNEEISNLQDTVGGDVQTRTLMSQVQKSIGPRVKEAERQAEARLDQMVTELQAGGYLTPEGDPTSPEVAQKLEAAKTSLRGQVAQARSEMLAEQLGNMTTNVDPEDTQAMAQLAAGLEQLGAQGADVEALMATNPLLAQAEASRQELIAKQMNDIVTLQKDRARVAGQTYPGSQAVREAAAQVADTASIWEEANKMAFGDRAPDPNAEEPQQQGFMGLPVAPATDSRERILQMLELVEQHPEHPPLQEAKRAMLESEQFKQYQTQRGYKDPKIAFRVMRKELRQKIRDDRRDTLQQVREDMKSGRIHGDLPRPKPSAPRKPTVPVQGADARQAEVKSGEA